MPNFFFVVVVYSKILQESFSSRLRHLQDETSTNIYISNLPLDTTEQVIIIIHEKKVTAFVNDIHVLVT